MVQGKLHVISITYYPLRLVGLKLSKLTFIPWSFHL